MQFVFRVDASIQIGTGHVMRCLSLAVALTEYGHECAFICRDHPGNLAAQIEGKGFKLYVLLSGEKVKTKKSISGEPATPHGHWLGVTWEYDVSQSREILSALNTDWLVVDHYALDSRWERKAAEVVGNIMVIDDLADRTHECAFLLDQNLGRAVSDYDGIVPDGCKRLVGPGYALLRPEFAMLRERSLERRLRPELKRILISLGGVDRTNVTGNILGGLAEGLLPSDTELDIILGSSAPYVDEIRNQVEQLPFQATVGVDVDDMAERMCLADLSIGAAGSTSWERCCLGVPAIIVVLAENQRSAANALSDRGAAIAVDNENMLIDAFSKLLAGNTTAEKLACMSSNAANLIDGKGCLRVTRILTKGIFHAD